MIIQFSTFILDKELGMSLTRAISKELSKTIMSAGGFGQKTMSHLKIIEAAPGMVMTT